MCLNEAFNKNRTSKISCLVLKKSIGRRTYVKRVKRIEIHYVDDSYKYVYFTLNREWVFG